ncbi:hypothetical protein M0813_12981 [Anaeramoeba flamelloides]|uniref:DDE Tnp4 domain-containing protein n=1 Tax=Anaeramoeba flamelloides TaxID=1746091 RepID=A0ABQ8Z9K4_9EUKA|nr:hypothetical protein M0813_12981 [Anaeramoeba flamelloides]
MTFRNLTGFSNLEFETLKNICLPRLTRRRVGRQQNITAHRKFFVLLTWLRKYPTFEELSIAFRMTKRKIYTVIKNAIEDVHQPLVSEYIKWYSKQEQEQNNFAFTNFPQCLAIVDVTVQPIKRPTENQRGWYSGKHKTHVIKSQTINGADGRVMHVYSGINGRVHDIAIWRNSNVEEQFQNNPILADKAYIGIQHNCQAIIPIRKPRNRELTENEKSFNKRVSSDRILIENYYARLKNKFKILSYRYRGSITEYKKIFEICCALTNFDVQLRPLRRRNTENQN